MEIRPEPRVKGQLPHVEGGMVRKGMRGRSWRALGVGDSTAMIRQFPMDPEGPQCDTGYQPPGAPISHYLSSIKREHVWRNSWQGENWGPTTLGPSPGASTPTGSLLGDELPNQDQGSNTNELCSPFYTFGTILRDCLQFCIYFM